MNLKLIFAWFLTALMSSFGSLASADDYPNKPIRLIVPYAAGGLTDNLARAFAQEMSTRLGQPVIVENKAGAGGIIGTEFVAKSKPDGYTLLLASQGLASVNTSLYPDLPYNTLKDFTPISLVAKFSMVLVVNPKQSFKTFSDLLTAIKSNPAGMSYGSAGNASTAHLTMEMLKDREKLQFLHIPYKGESLAFTELMGGRIDAVFATIGGATTLIQSGKILPLAVASKHRNKLLSKVPTLDELGIKYFDVFGWYAILSPYNLPNDIANRLNSVLVDIGKNQKLIESMNSRGIEIVGSSREEVTNVIKEETVRWGNIIKKLEIKPD